MTEVELFKKLKQITKDTFPEATMVSALEYFAEHKLSKSRMLIAFNYAHEPIAYLLSIEVSKFYREIGICMTIKRH